MKLNRKVVHLVTCWNSSKASQTHFLLAVGYKKRHGECVGDRELVQIFVDSDLE